MRGLQSPKYRLRHIVEDNPHPRIVNRVRCHRWSRSICKATNSAVE
jgi:hypothetical protein